MKPRWSLVAVAAVVFASPTSPKNKKELRWATDPRRRRTVHLQGRPERPVRRLRGRFGRLPAKKIGTHQQAD